MKSIILTLCLSLFLYGKGQGYEKTTIEINGGFKEFTTSSKDMLTVDIGTRYMFNEVVGLKLNIGYNQYVRPTEQNSHVYFSTIEGVIDFGELLRIKEMTKTFNVLGHIGGGIGLHKGNHFSSFDKFGISILGITPKFNVTERWSILVDASMQWNIRQHYRFNGDWFDGHNSQGVNFTGTLGLQYAFGKKEKKKWYDQHRFTEDKGNPSYVWNTSKPKTPVVAKDTTTDTTTKVVEPPKERMKEMIKTLIQSHYADVYFDKNSLLPKESSTSAIGMLVNYMKQNPEATVTLVGYTDKSGSVEYNQKLSLQRAETVKQLMVEVGVDSDRIITQGGGIEEEDNSYLSRRVKIIIN